MKITLVYFKNRDRKIFVKIDCIYVEVKCQLDARDDFYCRFYCLLNMFRAPLCPPSGVREYYTGGCCLWYLALWFSVVGMVCSWGSSGVIINLHLLSKLRMRGAVTPVAHFRFLVLNHGRHFYLNYTLTQTE